MLGEAAMTFDDAERYRVNYHEAIARLVRESTGDVRTAPGISVKLSALHPKYTFMHADIAIADLLPIVRDLATAARDANIHFTIDAEEADRLELSMDLIEALARDDSLFTAPRWQPLGRLRSCHPGLSEARRPDGRLDRASRAQIRSQVLRPAGQGRLLGYRDQAQPCRRVQGLSRLHAQAGHPM